MKYFVIFLLLLAIVVLSLTLGAQNNQLVTFNFLLAKGEYRLSTLLASLFACGFIIGWIICGLFYLRVKLRLINAERCARQAEHKSMPDTSHSATKRD